MRRERKNSSFLNIFRLVLIVWLSVFFTLGCATPFQSDRRGLFDVLSHYKESASGRRPVLEPSDRVSRFARKNMNGWRWPLDRVAITSRFGSRGRRHHDGVDLRAKIGTPIYSVQKGDVIYSGRKISGYGNMVVLKHPGGLVSIYAHNSRNLVKKGQKVGKGYKIALSGNTGRSTGPHLHFEVRKGVVAIDPLTVMPDRVGNRKVLVMK